jgi:methyl-accepting chemotaxis protein
MDEPRQKKKFRSLTITLGWAFLAISSAVLLVAVSLQMYFNFQNQRKMLELGQSLIAKDAARSVETYVEGKRLVLEKAVNIGNLGEVSQETKRVFLERLLGGEPGFRQLVLMEKDRKSAVKVSRLSQAALGQLTERVAEEIFLATNRGEQYHGNVYFDGTTSEPMMILAVPVRNVFGDNKGILAAELNLKFMWDLVAGLKVGETGFAYVIDRKGNLIAFGDIGRVLAGENLSSLRQVAEFEKSEGAPFKSGAAITKGIKGQYSVISLVPLGSPDWAVMVEMPVLEAYENVITTLKLGGSVVLLSIILAMIAAVNLSKRITRPIIDLRDMAKQISRGELDSKISFRSEDEIGELAESFNQMTENLKTTTVSRDSLAKEVEERIKAEKTTKEYAAKMEEAGRKKTEFV